MPTGQPFENLVQKTLTNYGLRVEKIDQKGGVDFLVFNNNPMCILECYGMSEKKKSFCKVEKYGEIICMRRDLISWEKNLSSEILKKRKQFKLTRELRKELKSLPSVLAVWVNNNEFSVSEILKQMLEHIIYGATIPFFVQEQKIIYRPEDFQYNDFTGISAFWIFSDDSYLNQLFYLNPHASIDATGLLTHLKIEEHKLMMQHPEQELRDRLSNQKNTKQNF